MADSSIDLKEIHDFLVDVAAEAGKIITSSLPTINSTDSKKNSEWVYHEGQFDENAMY